MWKSIVDFGLFAKYFLFPFMGVDKNNLTIFDISKGILGEDWEYNFLESEADITFHHI